MHPAMHPAGSLAPGRSCLAPPAGASHHQEPPVERVATPWNPSGEAAHPGPPAPGTPVGGERQRERSPPRGAASMHVDTRVYCPVPGCPCSDPLRARGWRSFSPCKATLTPTWLALWPDTSPPPGCSNSNDSAAGYVGSVFRHGTASTRHAGRRHWHQQLGEQKRMGRTTVSLPSWPSKAGPLLRCVKSRQLPGTLGGKPSPEPCPQSNTTTQKQLGRNS